MYITPIQSNVIKAFMMLSIILGHNHVLAPQDGSTHLFGFLYSFHVSIFFILPFFYNRKDTLTKKNMSKIVVRNGIPYFLFFIFCYFIYHFFIIKDGFECHEFFGGLINAPGYNVKDTTGFVYLWFLPVFMLMNICKLFSNQYKLLTVLFFLVGFTICINMEAYIFMWNSPFYILKALFYFSIGMSACFLYKYIKYINYIGTFFFIILTILYWTDIYQIKTYYFSLAGFFFIKEITGRFDFSKITLLSLIGKYSLPIYLMHVFIYNILERLLPYSLIWGIVNYCITIGLSLVISIGIYKTEAIRKFLFPKSWDEWIHFFQKNKRLNQ